MLGTWIKAERQRRGWTQIRLAERSGLAQTYISGLERGQYTNPSAEVLRGLAAAFELPLSTLMAVISSAPASAAPYLDALRDLGVPDETLVKLLPVVGELTADDWEGLLATAQRRQQQRAAQRIRPHPDPPRHVLA